MTIYNSNQKELRAIDARLLKEKQSDENIVETLKGRGVDSYYAQMVLENVKTDREGKKLFWKHILTGSFVFLAGLTLTLEKYYLAERGAIFFIFPGLMKKEPLQWTE